MINILFVDNHPIFRIGLKCLLSQISEYSVVTETGNGSEAVKLAKKLSPDLIILDTQIPTLDGVEASRQILAHNIHAKVIALSDLQRKNSKRDRRYSFSQ